MTKKKKHHKKPDSLPSAEQALTHFFFELGLLKKIEHAGMKFAGVKNPDTLGEHSCRAAQIGYAMGIIEGCNAEKVASMCALHDMGEIRVGDTHRIADHYIRTREGEKKAMYDQTQSLPSVVRDHIRNLWEEFHGQKTPESHVARDADLLDTMFQAKEYLDRGYQASERWLTNGSKYLKTATAKKIFGVLLKTKFTDWWDLLNTV